MMKALLRNQNDSTICLIFHDGYWFLPDIKDPQHAESELKHLTGLKAVRIIEKSSNLIKATCPDDTQENLDILIGWFNEEDAIRSIEEKEKKLLQESLAT